MQNEKFFQSSSTIKIVPCLCSPEFMFIEKPHKKICTEMFIAALLGKTKGELLQTKYPSVGIDKFIRWDAAYQLK